MDGFVDKDAAGGTAMFADLLRAPAEARAGLVFEALDEDAEALVAQALYVCEHGSKDEAVVALKVLDEVAFVDDLLALRPEAARVAAALCRPGRAPEILAAALPVYGAHVAGADAARTLLEMTGHEVAAVRAGAVEGIENFADEATFPQAAMELAERMIRLLTGDPAVEVRRAAAEAFILLDTWDGFDQAWIPHVIEGLARSLAAETDPRVRWRTAENLATPAIRDARHWELVAGALRPFMDDRDPRVAAWALARVATLGDPGALERMWATLETPGVHREYLRAAANLSVSYRYCPAKTRKGVRRALKRLRKEGWADDPSIEPHLGPAERDRFLELLIDSLARW